MSRKLKALATLAKIQKYELDAKSAELGTLQDAKTQLERQRDELERRRVEESSVTSPEAMPYMNGFLDSVRIEKDKLAKSGDVLDKKIEVALSEVIDTWQDTRKTEQVQEATSKIERKEEDDRAQSEIDEQTIQKFARRAKSP